MRISDQLDAVLAKHFAWSFAFPWETPAFEDRLRAAADVSERSDDVPDAGLSVELQANDPVPDDRRAVRTHDQARALCRPLTVLIADAWGLVDDDASLLSTRRLLVRADRLGADLVGLDSQPTEAVRLLRLFVRHSAKLTRRQRERAAAVAILVPLDRAEVSDLLVEIAIAGDRPMAAALLSDPQWAPPKGAESRLARRLADVIDAGPQHICRAVAIEFVARIDARHEAVGALRRALRLPSFGVRARALDALARGVPPAVMGEDLVQVLRDLVAHPPPDAATGEEQEEDERLLANAVVLALSHVRPPDAEEALLDLIDAEHETLWLDATWATEALAVSFAETAAAMVDHWLKCARAYERARALPALSRLPNGLAEPRLRLAVGDPAFSVRDPAQRQWLERFQRVCAVRVEDIPAAELLRSPPSERFWSRLGVMHGRVGEARIAMGRALLVEGPDREALVLLLQLVGDDTGSGEPTFGPRDEGWASAIVERFGALGVEGLCALAARFPEPETFGWMRRLGDLLERKVIVHEIAGPLRTLAAEHADSDDSLRVDDAMRILARVGAPPELLERVLSIALEDDFGAAEARGLLVAWPDRAMDARLTSEMALALAERQWARLRAASAIALARGAPAARVIAQRVIEVAEQVPEAVHAAVECAHHLRAANLLGETWALSALSRPDLPLFTVVSRAWRGSAAVRAALERCLTSEARGGASAVEAAIALLHEHPPMSPRDRRLVAVLERSATAERAELVHALCVQGAPFGMVAPHLAELLVSSDPNVTRALVGVAVWLRSPKARSLLRTVLPRVTDFDLRSDIEEALGTGHAPYWAES